MPDLKPEVLLKLTPNKRWRDRMNHAWHECKGLPPEKIKKLEGDYIAPEVHRPEDARFYTDYAPIVESPDPERPGFVIRTRAAGQGRIQVWRPGRPSKVVKDMVQEVYDGQDWYGFSVLVNKTTDYAAIKAQVVDLLKRFKTVKLAKPDAEE